MMEQTSGIEKEQKVKEHKTAKECTRFLPEITNGTPQPDSSRSCERSITTASTPDECETSQYQTIDSRVEMRISSNGGMKIRISNKMLCDGVSEIVVSQSKHKERATRKDVSKSSTHSAGSCHKNPRKRQKTLHGDVPREESITVGVNDGDHCSGHGHNGDEKKHKKRRSHSSKAHILCKMRKMRRANRHTVRTLRADDGGNGNGNGNGELPTSRSSDKCQKPDDTGEFDKGLDGRLVMVRTDGTATRKLSDDLVELERKIAEKIFININSPDRETRRRISYDMIEETRSAMALIAPKYRNLENNIVNYITDGGEFKQKAITDGGNPEQKAITDGGASSANVHPPLLLTDSKTEVAETEIDDTNGTVTRTSMEMCTEPHTANALVPRVYDDKTKQLVRKEVHAKLNDTAINEAVGIVVYRGINQGKSDVVVEHHVCVKKVCVCKKRPCTCSGVGCTFDLAIDVVGLAGCAALSRRIQSDYNSTAGIDPNDIWRCRESGNIHICTDALCTAKTLAADGTIQCDFTGKWYGKPLLPDSTSYFSGDFHPTSDVAKMNDDIAIVDQLACRAAPRVDWRDEVKLPKSMSGAKASVKKSGTLIAIQDNTRAESPNSKRRRQTKGSTARWRTDGFDGVTQPAVAAVIIERWKEITGHRYPDRKPSTVQRRPGKMETILIDIGEGDNNTERLIEFECKHRSELLYKLFGEQPTQQQPSSQPPKWMETGYVWSLDMASRIVMLLPSTIADAPSVTEDRAIQYIDVYGRLVWDGWTLASWYRTHDEIHKQQETRKSSIQTLYKSDESMQRLMSPKKKQTSHQDSPIQVSQFAIGLLYQARYGYHINAKISEIEGYAENKDKILPAMRRLLGASPDESEETLLERFSKTMSIVFLKRDGYLETRLVNKATIGTRSILVDGHRFDSSFINQGTGLVVDNFSRIANWSLRKLVDDIVIGVDPYQAMTAFTERSKSFLIR